MNKDEDGEVLITVVLLQKVRTEGLTVGLYVSTYTLQKQDRNGGPSLVTEGSSIMEPSRLRSHHIQP